jgi:hypothetical protein
MPSFIESGYLNFMKSKLKVRNDFLLRYSELHPEFVKEPYKKFLKDNLLRSLNEAQLLEIEIRISEIEKDIELQLKSKN